MIEIDPSEITPEHIFMNRRKFIAGAAAMAAGAVLVACDRRPPATNTPAATEHPPTPDTVTPQASKETDELGDKLTPYKTITNYNNYYEFSLEKEDVAFIAMRFKTRPWQVQVGGLVRKPKTYDIEELLKFGQEERIYRLRCVEAWSMVVPWVGFPLRKLLEAVEPTSEARFVRFETIMAPEQMIGLRASYFPWPYTEGLRLDEAMHDLTILATGLYGKPLTPQNGAPIRLVVPWKYGFKYIKSIIKIDLVKEMPKTFWVTQAPEEYGFYANVNPNVDHPRWSQATERRLGEPGRRKTLMFNGYEQEVAALYKGMDLRVNY